MPSSRTPRYRPGSSTPRRPRRSQQANASAFSTASSRAFGASASLNLLSIPIVTIPQTPVSSGTAPPAYNDADSALSVNLVADALLADASVSTGVLNTTAASPVP